MAQLIVGYLEDDGTLTTWEFPEVAELTTHTEYEDPYYGLGGGIIARPPSIDHIELKFRPLGEYRVTERKA